MRLETIYLKANTSFSKAIEAWCAANANEVVHTKERYELTIENYDSLLIISENQSISRRTGILNPCLIRIKSQPTELILMVR